MYISSFNMSINNGTMVLKKHFELGLIEAYVAFFKAINHRYCGKFQYKIGEKKE